MSGGAHLADTVDLEVKVRDLQIGDYLPTTKRVILAIERRSDSFRTVRFRRDSGVEGLGSWGADTVINVRRVA